MDIVERIQQMYNIELMDCQKEFLKELDNQQYNGAVSIANRFGQLYIYPTQQLLKELIASGTPNHS